MARCRDCKLFDLEAAKNKAGRVMSEWAVKCFWVSKEQYPISVTGIGRGIRPQPGRVTATNGNHCPCFQKRGAE